MVHSPEHGLKLQLLAIALIAALVFLHYLLWLDENGVRQTHTLRISIQAQTEDNAERAEKNHALAAEIEDLKRGLMAIEERARADMGMIRPDETFYRLLEKPVAPAATPNKSAPPPKPLLSAKPPAPAVKPSAPAVKPASPTKPSPQPAKPGALVKPSVPAAKSAGPPTQSRTPATAPKQPAKSPAPAPKPAPAAKPAPAVKPAPQPTKPTPTSGAAQRHD